MKLALEYVGPSTWLPDETLFSLCSRIHRLSGHARAADTCRMLFGHPRLGAAHDLPSRIDTFASRFENRFGLPEEIIRQRTLLSFYLPFKSPSLGAEAIAAMRGDYIGSLKYRLGLLTSRFRAHHVLKCCSACMAADEHEHGVAYWHRQHQWPGAWLCLKHDVPLVAATIKANGVERFLFHLPDSVPLEGGALNESTPSAIRVSACVAAFAEAIASQPAGMHLDALLLRQTYLARLAQRDYTTPSGRLRLQKIGPSLSRWVAQVRCWPDMAALPDTPERTVAQFSRLLRMPRAGAHPIRHLVLMGWLFEHWSEFWSAYQKAGVGPLFELSAAPPPESQKLEKSPEQSAFLALMRQNALSVSSASRKVGVTTQTGLEWASQAGFAISRRPKRLDENLRRRVIRALETGMSNQSVAAETQLSVSTVARVLRGELGLLERCNEARFLKQRNRMRAKWRRALTQWGALGIKQVRAQQERVYIWLYRYDRAWLVSSNQSAASVRRGNNVYVDWDRRDRDLAMLVAHVADELTQDNDGKPLALWQIAQRVPELRAKLGHLERLPLTVDVIRASLRRRSGLPTPGLFE